jgi:hypothetical protein
MRVLLSSSARFGIGLACAAQERCNDHRHSFDPTNAYSRRQHRRHEYRDCCAIETISTETGNYTLVQVPPVFISCRSSCLDSRSMSAKG